jgi:hypothetical protein
MAGSSHSSRVPTFFHRRNVCPPRDDCALKSRADASLGTFGDYLLLRLRLTGTSPQTNAAGSL